MTRYILVDGTGYIYRAFFAMPALTSPDNQPTGCIYGVVNMVKKLAVKYPNDKIIVVFDPKGPTARNKTYAPYKANRSESPDDLIAQIQPTIDLIKAHGWPTIVVPGIEADDVIGTLARQALDLKHEVLISTADKDFAQLVQPGLTIINTMTNKLLDHDGVVAKFGVRPNQIVDYLALIGDVSDNIPGIPKVGPKTAVKWLQAWGSISAIKQQADSIPGKVGENLRNNLNNLDLYQDLVTINTNIDVDILSLKSERNPEALQDMLMRFGFKHWLKQTTDLPNNNKLPAISKISNFPEDILQSKECAFYCLELMGKLYIYLYASNANIFEICWHDVDVSVHKQIKEFMLNARLIGYNCKAQLKLLSAYNIKINNICFDILLAEYLLKNPDRKFDLGFLAQKYLNIYTKYIGLDDILLEAAESVWVIFFLFKEISITIDQDKAIKHIFYNIDLPCMMVLYAMEQFGVLIDTKKLHQQSQSLVKEIDNITTQVHSKIGYEFNLSSPKQLGQVLFEHLALPCEEKTALGSYSTSDATLQNLVDQHDIIPLILKHRHLSKLNNTYCSKLGQLVDNQNRIHCTYNQTMTVTGRLSATSPNLQNIPIRTQHGRYIRQSFIASPGYKLISADYNQIELRLMAHFSEDEYLCKALASGVDIHSSIAKEIFGCHEVSSEQRRQAKVVNFGLIYGMSAFGLAKQLSIDNNTAKDLCTNYFSKFPGVSNYLKKTRESAVENGYVETFLGRKIYFNAGGKQKAAVLRAAVNAPIQGSGAELIKLAMVNLHSKLCNFDATIIMQVHDELVLEVANRDVDQVVSLVRSTMESALVLRVPLLVEVGVAHNWDEAH